jgi:hypothetical protein
MTVRHGSRTILGSLGLALMLVATGCQSDFNGQTLPSAHWQTDDVQYFPAGAEFRLAREAAAMQAAKRNQAQGGRPLGSSPVQPNPLPPAPGPAAPVIPGGEQVAPPQPLAPPAGQAFP